MTKPARKTKSELKNESAPKSEAMLRDATAEILDTKAFQVGKRQRLRVLAPQHDPDLDGPSQVQQHFKDEVDINNIILKYTQTGQITHFAPVKASFGEAPNISFTEAMQIVTGAQEQFMDLPSEVRKHFNNDPAALLDAIQDPEQRGTMQELGLLAPDPVDPGPVQVQVMNPPEQPAQE